MKRLGLSIMFLICALIGIQAKDFTYQGIKYTVIDEEAKTCRTFEGDVSIRSGYNGKYPPSFSGGNKYEGENLDLPEKVYDGETEYTLTEVGYCSFNNNSITSVTIPNSVTKISAYAFFGCSKLSDIIVAGSVQSIGNKAFAACGTITNIRFEYGESELAIEDLFLYAVSSIYTSSNYTSYITNLFLDRNITNSGIGFPTVSNVEFGTKMNSISQNAFKSQTIRIDKGYGMYDEHNYVNKMEKVVIPDNIKSIGDGAFYNSSKLYSIVIGKGCENIGKDAFYGCSNIRSVTSKNTVPPQLNSGFSDETTSTGRLMVPYNTKFKYQTTDYWLDFKNIVELEEESEPVYTVDQLTGTIYMIPDEEKSLSGEIEDLAVASWASTNQTVATVDASGNVTANSFGRVYIIAKDSEGADLAVFELFVCPTIAVEHGSGTIYQHHVLYNSKPSLYIAAPEGYEIAGVTHDDMDVTDAVVNNNGNYVAAAPITDNSVINLSLRAIDPSIPTEVNPTEIPDANVKVLVYGRQVAIEGADEAAYVTITDESGKVYYNDTDKSITLANGGIYIIKIEGSTSTYKIIVR